MPSIYKLKLIKCPLFFLGSFVNAKNKSFSGSMSIVSLIESLQFKEVMFHVRHLFCYDKRYQSMTQEVAIEKLSERTVV